MLPITQNLWQWQWQERKQLAVRIKPPVGMKDKLSHGIWKLTLCFARGEQKGALGVGTAGNGDLGLGAPGPRPLSRVLTTARKRRSYRPWLPSFSLPWLVFQPSPIHFGPEIEQ